MATLTLRLNEGLTLYQIGRVFQNLSTLYRISACIDDESVPLSAMTTRGSQIEFSDDVPDLAFVKWQPGSHQFDVKADISASITRVTEYILAAVDPVSRERRENQILIEQSELEKRSLEVDLLSIKRTERGLEVIQKAIDVHDQLIERQFSDDIAKAAFYNAMRSISEIVKLQDSNDAFITPPKLDVSDQLS